MAGSFADYLENKLVDHVFGGVIYTPPSTFFIGLSTTAITDAGTNITEPSGGSYSRIAVANNNTNFPSAQGGTKTNGIDFTFTTPTDSWGTITDFFISDAASGGNILCYGSLNVTQTISAGNIVKFTTGALIFTLS